MSFIHASLLYLYSRFQLKKIIPFYGWSGGQGGAAPGCGEEESSSSEEEGEDSSDEDSQPDEPALADAVC